MLLVFGFSALEPRAKNADTLQVEFDDIIHEAERKLLDAVINNLCSDVAAY